MPTVIVSLGSIVKTDATKTIHAFQALADELHLSLQVPQLMPKLQLFFIDFNLGNLSTKNFKAKVSEIFFKEAKKQDEKSKKAFSDSFESCWNAMCIVDDQAKKVMQYILDQIALNANSVIIYSDTNPLNLEFVMRQFNFDPSIIVRVRTTFDDKCAKDKLLLAIANQLYTSNPTEKIILLLGKNDQIKDPILLAMTEERDAKVMDAASAAQLTIKRLEDARVSISDLESLMPKEERRRSSSKPLVPAFDAMTVRQDSPRHSPLRHTAGSDDALLGDKPRQERSPSPT